MLEHRPTLPPYHGVKSAPKTPQSPPLVALSLAIIPYAFYTLSFYTLFFHVKIFFHVKNKSINGAFFTPKRHRSTLMLVYASTLLSLLYQASYIASIITKGAVALEPLLCYMLAVYACHSLYFLSCQNPTPMLPRCPTKSPCQSAVISCHGKKYLTATHFLLVIFSLHLSSLNPLYHDSFV